MYILSTCNWARILRSEVDAQRDSLDQFAVAMMMKVFSVKMFQRTARLDGRASDPPLLIQPPTSSKSSDPAPNFLIHAPRCRMEQFASVMKMKVFLVKMFQVWWTSIGPCSFRLQVNENHDSLDQVASSNLEWLAMVFDAIKLRWKYFWWRCSRDLMKGHLTAIVWSNLAASSLA